MRTNNNYYSPVCLKICKKKKKKLHFNWSSAKNIRCLFFYPDNDVIGDFKVFHFNKIILP